MYTLAGGELRRYPQHRRTPTSPPHRLAPALPSRGCAGRIAAGVRRLRARVVNVPPAARCRPPVPSPAARGPAPRPRGADGMRGTRRAPRAPLHRYADAQRCALSGTRSPRARVAITRIPPRDADARRAWSVGRDRRRADAARFGDEMLCKTRAFMHWNPPPVADAVLNAQSPCTLQRSKTCRSARERTSFSHSPYRYRAALRCTPPPDSVRAFPLQTALASVPAQREQGASCLGGP
jgi:hypothetical protein